ncbi:hypothetical protein CP258_02720 [Corynebacterium pseudotuberculosis 258]|uniref:Uncharacterized protein n=1 Tax=Corynebacterium pseudotuberculosis 258 TaxID=1168865 RepID=A0AAX1FKL8_CORPS|nr:hypothetical protein [Corynebacterium pseudotuberculosis]QGW56938.1 hypothetical protein CP258_02720 [Corynebacterium pseudotuberculosis 258]QGW57443.1 hypothetical protein CPCIP5297_02720 [Corynebacterium pseudotuberculosis CIP 52.97]
MVDPSTVQKVLGSAGTLLSPQEEPYPTAAKETEPKHEAPAQNTEKVVLQP